MEQIPIFGLDASDEEYLFYFRIHVLSSQGKVYTPLVEIGRLFRS